MPPAKKIQKESIIAEAFEMTRTLGIDSINARALAKRLGCSVQPIFSNFATMQELKSAVVEEAKECYHAFVDESCGTAERPYKGLGMGYIMFAAKEPKLFQLLFMSDVNEELQKYLSGDTISDQYVKAYGGRATGLPDEKMREFHQNMFLFSHGIATLLATQTCSFTEEEISEKLTQIFQSQKALFRSCR